MQKVKLPPDLDKYLKGRNHKYMTYQQAAKMNSFTWNQQITLLN